MKNSLKGSETEKNLRRALEGEALAHLKYQFYKSVVSDYSKEFENILDEIIHNEKEHGKIWFKQLHGGEMPSSYMSMVDSMSGELYECHELYPKFSEIAKEEGFDEISQLFDEISKIECKHANVFKEMKENFTKDLNMHKNVFEFDDVVEWKCLNCGHIHIGKNAPDVCPVCNHPQKFFKNIGKNK